MSSFPILVLERRLARTRARLPAALLLGSALLAGAAGGPVAAQAPVEPPAAVAAQAVQPAGVSINSADATQLAAVLVGVGPRRAEAIVRYREQFGPFGSIEELTEVRGIGAATLQRNRALIRLD